MDTDLLRTMNYAKIKFTVIFNCDCKLYVDTQHFNMCSKQR